MEYILTGIVIVIFALLVGFSGAHGQSNNSKAKTDVSSSVEAKSFNRNELKQKLIALSKSPAPSELAMGAMCYRPAMPPKSADYTCPKCGEKTLYSIENIENKNEGYQIIGTVNVGIPNCRRTIKNIKGINITLDESQYCRKCSPDIQSPKLVLIIEHEDGKKHTVTGITNNDLILISEFLSGSDKHKDEGDFETPLKKHIKRLSELLGVEVKIDDEEIKDEK